MRKEYVVVDGIYNYGIDPSSSRQHSMVITYYSKSKYQPGKVANPARNQLNREKQYLPVAVCA